MKFLKLLIIFILFNLAMITQEVRAQETPTNQLYQGLGDLRKNVEQLNIANQTLILKNEKMKILLKDLQLSYQKLLQENLQLEDQQTKLQKSIAPQSQRIDQLNESLSDLSNQEAALNQQIKKSQDQIAALKSQDAQLNSSADQTMQSSDDSSEGISSKTAEILQQKQKQKLAMLKLISESQDHQTLLQAKFLDYKKNVPGLGGILKNKKEVLEAQIFQLQNEIIQLNSLVNNSKPAWSEEQMHQLELSVSNLEQNKNELKALLKQMQQKNQKIIQSQTQSEEELKLSSNIETFKREASFLRIDLEELQQQMVDLDKRKAYLEALLQK